jgi:hypothetical protein
MSLERLTKEYPLSEQWGSPSVLQDTTRVHDVQVHIVGLCAQDRAGQIVTGSAGDLSALPVERAYFELLERTAIVAMHDSKPSRLITRRADGSVCESVDNGTLFPLNPDPKRWRYAKSNGVAAGITWEGACARADAELIERDRVLRSWYGEADPVRVEVPAALPSQLNALYAFEAYHFDESDDCRVHVAGVFGFPRRAEAPFLCGFGARATRSAALAAAAGECVQRLGFLWGEDIPSAEPEFSPTPDFHQEFYLWPSAQGRLRDWLKGAPGRQRTRSIAKEETKSERKFIDLTPIELGSKAFVAMAVPRDEVPLIFGDGHPKYQETPGQRRIHPLS